MRYHACNRRCFAQSFHKGFEWKGAIWIFKWDLYVNGAEGLFEEQFDIVWSQIESYSIDN